MDKNKIKAFAVWARRNLINAVSEKASRIGIAENRIENAIAVQGGFKLEDKDEIFKLPKSDRDKLVKEVKEKGFQQVMEEAAYTWFNRFMGLRYMEVNDYLPSGIRVLSSEVEGKTEPDVLTRVSEVIEELNLKAEYIYELLDSGRTEDREEAYKHILVRQCNELGKIIPQMFEKISDYTELLLPDNLLEEGSVIRKMVEDIDEKDWKAENSFVEGDNVQDKNTGGVEIIGWMYQYYISEKKDEVFAALKNNVKITKENIPAATQLFTPKWIVKYMVENSLGRLWLEGHPNEELQANWKYYLEEAEQEPEVEEELKKIREEHSKLTPEDIKVLDPCMGSGHILVYAFDVLYEIYKTAGYSEREIPKMILQNNLYGLDIDDRAAQLASFALIMKARHYNRRLFREIEREGLELNLCAIQESNGISSEAIDYFVGENKELRKDVEYLVEVFTDAKEYGSILEVREVDFETIERRLDEIKSYGKSYAEKGFEFPEEGIEFPIEFSMQIDVFTEEIKKVLIERIPVLVKQGRIMSRKYEICVTNPPYMSTKGMNDRLKKMVDIKYKNSKMDMFSVFMEIDNIYLKKYGYYATINQHSWMFLNSFEKLRKQVLENQTIINMIHLGARAFDEIGGEVVQTTSFIRQRVSLINYYGSYIRLVGENSSEKKESRFHDIVDNRKQFLFKQSKFGLISGCIIAYWVSQNIIKLFQSSKIEDYATPCIGMRTGDNSRFLRLWYEVNNNLMKLNCSDALECINSKKRWFPYNKGGTNRKWYGNNEYIVNWENNGEEIKENTRKSYPQLGDNLSWKISNEKFYFMPSITWSFVSTSTFAARYSTKGFLFDVGGSCLFPKDINMFLGILNSKIGDTFLKILNPTMNYQTSNIGNIPAIIDDKNEKEIHLLVKKNIYISKQDWDSFETSWDFKTHPLLKLLDKGEQYKLSAVFTIWETECEEAFNQLKHNEEELNKIFIEIYGLQDELTPEVEDKDITIRKADRERDIKSLISYAVGCMLGRYSIDAEGLIYAGGDFKDKWDLENKKIRKIEKDEEGNIISDSWVDATFLPDGDNVIPITEDEYFEDDVVARFIRFIKTVYGEETLEENLDFIADSIGRKSSETARQAIRRYFIKDFYKDHLKVYQKRPIYWMFNSGKNDGFKALVYMHRYNQQTVARVRTDYLHTLQRKYEAEIQRQQLIIGSEEYTAKDKTAAKKKIERISKQIEECREYDQIVAHLANERIAIDLDDGVKVNYAKFQGIKVINSKGKEVKMDLLAKV